MPQRHFLTAPASLCQQVADFLLQCAGEETPDLSGTRVITPTAGAARHINKELKAAGCKPPAMVQPMQALLPESERTASAVERCLAWSEALQAAAEAELQALFWQAIPKTSNDLLKAGRKFCQLCDQLAEAALTPNTFTLPPQLAGSFDAGRWQAIAALYRNYLEYLQHWQLDDPNELRLARIRQPGTTCNRLVIAAVADLPTAAAHYAASLEAQGIPVELLIWNPGNAAETDFDRWGRPLPEAWNSRRLELAPTQIKVCASARDEARLAASYILEHAAAPAGLIVADPKLHTTLAGEILACGRRPYRPEGDPLIRGEAATLALEWEEFRQHKDLSRLRRLLELPAFCRALDAGEPVLSQAEALVAIDQLLGLTIATTLDAARAATTSTAALPAYRSQDLARIRHLLGRVHTRLADSSLDLLELAFPHPDERSRSVARVLEIGYSLATSAAVKNWSQRSGGTPLPVQVFAQALRTEQIQSAAGVDDIVLNGWLEAAWLPQSRRHICGVVDGCLPQSIDGDPFLPDSIRPALGLSHNALRLARDSYLLDCLQHSSGHELTLSFSKYNHEGDPNRPSRLLLRTDLTALPARVKHVLAPSASTRQRPKRHTGWRWQLPAPLPRVEKISPTQFKSYLECPFRFCLEKVLKLETGPTAAREMDAAVFGNLIHHTLESFGNRVIPLREKMLLLDEPTLREWVQQELEKEASRQFGPSPAPAVQVQLASAASRLNAFARKQAECFQQGWMILQVEAKLAADSDHPLMIGALALSGMIDRIEQHVETGALRILDYKTFSSLQKPAQTHFGPVSRQWLPAPDRSGPQPGDSPALIQVNGKQRAWTDLQLPLYRRILEHWYPDETAQNLPEVAYFVLPSDPNESGIYRFDELNEADHYAAALACAEAVAASIAAGVFWPPQPFRGNWDDPLAPLFANGAPDQCIDPATITLLKGGQ